MASREKQKASPFFQSGWNGALVKIVVVSLVFHALILLGFVAANSIRFEKEPEPVKIFELVQVSQAKKPAPRQVRKSPPPKPPEEKKEPRKEEPKPKPKPEVKKELPPEPKVAKEEKPAPEPEPVPEEEPEEAAEETMDLPDDMDLPESIAEESGLNPVGYVDMDPLMQVYLERLKQIIMQNFNPPSGLNVAKSTKTSVQFTVDRFGSITDISLKRSSGNKTWDHLSMRAIRISKLPELPPNYRAPALSLNFNFTPN